MSSGTKKGRYARVPTIEVPLDSLHDGDAGGRDDLEMQEMRVDDGASSSAAGGDSRDLLSKASPRTHAEQAQQQRQRQVRKILCTLLVMLGSAAFSAAELWTIYTSNPSGSTDGNTNSNARNASRCETPAYRAYVGSLGDAPSLDVRWTTTPAPSLTSESSVRLVDVNGDGVLDALVGFGVTGSDMDAPDNASCPTLGFSPCGGGVVALDGRSGERLWLHGMHHEAFSVTCGLLDGDGDGHADCLASGRYSQLDLIDARTGRALWSASDALGRFKVWNVYTPALTDDLDGDGVPDLVVAHGGDARAAPWEVCRRAGELLLVSGATGRQIGHGISMPEGKETYMSPVVFAPPGGGEAIVLFGTGGESVAGSLWAIRLRDLLARSLGKRIDGNWTWGGRRSESVSPGAVRVIEGVGRGVAVPPVVADMTGDGFPDLLVSVFDGTVMLVDGKTGRTVWKRENPGYEFYSSPAIGRFNGDSTPDVLLQTNQGRWFSMTYNFSLVAVLDGRDGSVLWQMRTVLSIMRSPLVLRRAADDPAGDVFLFWVAGRKVWTGTHIQDNSCPRCARSKRRQQRGERFGGRRFAAELAVEDDDDDDDDGLGGRAADVAAKSPSMARHVAEDGHRREKRHGGHGKTSGYSPGDDVVCTAEQQLLGERIRNITQATVEDTARRQRVGYNQAGCDVDESVYDAEVFVLDYGHRCAPIKLDAATQMSMTYGDAKRKYASDPAWMRYEQAQMEKFSTPSADSRSRRHGGEEHKHESSPSQDPAQLPGVQGALPEGEDGDFGPTGRRQKLLPSDDPSLCAMLRPELMGTPAVGDIDGDGEYDMVWPLSQVAVVVSRGDDGGGFVRTESMMSFRALPVFPATNLTAVSHCDPGGEGAPVADGDGIDVEGLLPPWRQAWTGYLGTCGTNDADAPPCCGSV